MSTTKNVKTPADAVEYLPDAMEIQQARLPWYSKVGVLWIGLIVAAVVVWACIGQVDVIVRAHGRVVSDRGDIVMKPMSSAVIKSIHVKKGDIVQPGDVLITFDPAINQAEVDRLTREIGVLTSELERYEAEFNGKDYVPKNGLNTDWQKSIFAQRQKYYREKLNYYDSVRNRLVAARKSTKESFETYTKILNSTREIESMYMKLRDTNVVSYKELLEVSMSRMQNEAQVDQLRSQGVEYEHQLLSIEAERNAFVEEWRNSISEKLVSLSRELDGDLKQRDRAERLVSYVSLQAPCRAIVHDMASFPVGSAVGEAEAVMTLVPLDGSLEVEAEVRPQDIGRVHVASNARVKLSAFPFQKHGTLDGKVRLISGNTFQRSAASVSKNAEENPNGAFYRCNVTVSGRLRNVADDFVLIPGMETEVEIKSGRRRIIEYLIYPLLKGLDEAFREP